MVCSPYVCELGNHLGWRSVVDAFGLLVVVGAFVDPYPDSNPNPYPDPDPDPDHSPNPNPNPPYVALSRPPPNIHPVSAALSPRLVGGVDINLAGELARAQHAKLFGAMEAAKKRTGAGAVAVSTPLPAAKRPNVVVVVLESTTGTLATASNSHGVSPWLKELSGR